MMPALFTTMYRGQAEARKRVAKASVDIGHLVETLEFNALAARQNRSPFLGSSCRNDHGRTGPRQRARRFQSDADVPTRDDGNGTIEAAAITSRAVVWNP
jgi:hypothetical protein